MVVGAVGAALLAATVGYHTRKPPKPNHHILGIVRNHIKLFENLAVSNLANKGDGGVRPCRVQRGDSYITERGRGGNSSVGGDSVMEMTGRRRGGNSNKYCRMGRGEEEIGGNKRIGGWDGGGCCPSVLQDLIEVNP